MAYLLTFLEGIATFCSPCLLPLLPVYLAFFAGRASGDESAASRSNALAALAFVAGFSAVFLMLGMLAASLGSLLVAYRRPIEIACGAFIALLGLNYLGVLHIPILERTLRPLEGSAQQNPLGAFGLGIAFAVGWSPCVGTFLSAALGLAATSGSALKGLALLACYCGGLGLPFVLAAVAIERLEGAIGWIRTHYQLVNRTCGVLLVALGVLLATGWLNVLMSQVTL